MISCANYPGCASHSHFAGDAAYGYCPSKSQFVWGMRLVLVSDPKGVPVGYDLVGPKTGQERECAGDLACGQAGSVLFCDKGLLGPRYYASVELTEVELVTPERHRLAERPRAEVEKARIRLVIESVFANLKCQMRLDAHLAKTSAGWSNESLSGCSRSRSGCSATCSPVARRERSSPMTDAEPTSAL